MILGPLFFRIYINDLSRDLTLHSHIFLGDSSLFSVFQNINSRTTDSTNDLSKTTVTF